MNFVSLGSIILFIFFFIFFIQIHDLTFGPLPTGFKGSNRQDIFLLLGLFLTFLIDISISGFWIQLPVNLLSLMLAVFALFIFVQSKGSRWVYGFLGIALVVVGFLPYFEGIQEAPFYDIGFFIYGIAFLLFFGAGGIFDHYWMLRTLRNEQVGEVSGETA